MYGVTKRSAAVSSSVDEHDILPERRVTATSETVMNDDQLLVRAGQGDAASFEALFHRHYDRVYGILFRLVGERAEAEDLAQEVFLRLYDEARKRGRQNKDNLPAWLYRVATNLGYNALRGRRRRWQRDAVLLPEPPAHDPAGAAVDRRAERAAVRAALARIGERQAQLLILRQMDFSYAECAAICGIAPGSVGKLLARAARDFKRAYARSSGE